MRHEGQLLTVEESLKLISDINRWCRKTGTNYNKLVVAARVAPSLRSMVRNRKRRITINVAQRLKTAMQANRQGISRDQHKNSLRYVSARPKNLSAAEIDLMRLPTREPCPKCGVRSDLGCKHISSANHFWGR